MLIFYQNRGDYCLVLNPVIRWRLKDQIQIFPIKNIWIKIDEQKKNANHLMMGTVCIVHLFNWPNALIYAADIVDKFHSDR